MYPLNLPLQLSKSVNLFLFLVSYLHFAFLQGKKKARRASIAVQRPDPVQGPPITWTNNQVRSDSAWVSKDDKLNIIRFQHFLDHAPKIVLPVTLPMMQKPLTPAGWKKLEEITDKLLDSSQPARCTSAQYLDRNGNPLLFYFGRRLVRDDDKNVSVSWPMLCLLVG
jgi:hypothetical protein